MLPAGADGQPGFPDLEPRNEQVSEVQEAGGGTPDGEDPAVWNVRGNGTGAPPVGQGRPLRLPDMRELRRPLDFQRALRPLLRTVNTGPELLLDEETTVRDSADARAVVPALVRSPERWLDLALVIDTGPSMILWDKLIAEFRGMLTRLGAFRVIRTWYLRSDGKGVSISAASSDASQRAARELIDPVGRQAIIVVTDCVGDPWHTGQAMGIIGDWARTGPLAIVQVLSEDLWSRSGLICRNVQLAAPRAAASNDSLIVDPGGSRSHAGHPHSSS